MNENLCFTELKHPLLLPQRQSYKQKRIILHFYYPNRTILSPKTEAHNSYIRTSGQAITHKVLPMSITSGLATRPKLKLRFTEEGRSPQIHRPQKMVWLHSNTRNKNYRSISIPHDKDSNMLNKTFANRIEICIEKIIYHDQTGYVPKWRDDAPEMNQ